ncbi:MAG TPA: ion transporter [Micromonosporaceae bacterium]|nr:ion transporter [Micromonosporaceae bacterium]
MPSVLRHACTWIGYAIWVLFIADYLVRLALADRWRAFVRRNWFDLPILALPMLRPLRLLRVLVALRVLGRGGARFARGRVVASIAAAVAAGGAVAALAMLDAERSNAAANIRDYGDALWWAMSTITTVGYGDRYPTTTEGRLVAAALMVAGIAMLGVITASLASWFVERVSEVSRAEQAVEVKLDALISEVEKLRTRIDHRQHDE